MSRTNADSHKSLWCIYINRYKDCWSYIQWEFAFNEILGERNRERFSKSHERIIVVYGFCCVFVCECECVCALCIFEFCTELRWTILCFCPSTSVTVCVSLWYPQSTAAWHTFESIHTDTTQQYTDLVICMMVSSGIVESNSSYWVCAGNTPSYDVASREGKTQRKEKHSTAYINEYRLNDFVHVVVLHSEIGGVQFYTNTLFYVELTPNKQNSQTTTTTNK